MSAYLSLPLVFLHFWFLEAPWAIIRSFGNVNASYLQLTSLRLLVQTFFMPVKNEYRKGLVLFSIGMGIFLKSILILISLLGLGVVVAIEIMLFLCFLVTPIIAVTFLFR
jgi:hypothetical protein